jgi:hypothetical protein
MYKESNALCKIRPANIGLEKRKFIRFDHTLSKRLCAYDRHLRRRLHDEDQIDILLVGNFNNRC